MGFKPYEQDQILLLPPNLGELIGENDLCRVISEFVEALPRDNVEGAWDKDNGCPPYHPRMMLKVLLYAYSQKIYSSRKIAKALRQHVGFMWLAAMATPSHCTVNRFRSEYFKDTLGKVFAALARMLLEEEYILDQDYFADGTIMEANAGRYTHVWRKNTERYEKAVTQRAAEIIEEARKTDLLEETLFEGGDLPERGEASTLDSKTIRKAARALSERQSPQAQKSARALEKEAGKKEKYEAQKEKLGSRNSYSKTDEGATFMRTKQDLLRPAYNVMAGTQQGFITGVSVHQSPNDGAVLVPHLEARAAVGLPAPPSITGDAAFGTEENYSYTEERKIESYLKYPSFYRETKGKCRPFEKANFRYDAENDRFVCPQGNLLRFVFEKDYTTSSGYTSTQRTYQSSSCAGCPSKEECTRSDQRSIKHSVKLGQQRDASRARLQSEKGRSLCKARSHAIETVFGHLKHNMGFARFLLRGLRKVTLEMLWHSLAYNLKRMRNQKENPKNQKKKLTTPLRTAFLSPRTSLWLNICTPWPLNMMRKCMQQKQTMAPARGF